MVIRKVAVDDNILIKDKISTAGSKILSNFTSPIMATVIEKLKNEGIDDIVQTIPNEFGISLTSNFGCIDSVATGDADIGIGVDVNGAIRKEASKNGICFIKPTYGMVSRFGLVSTSPSMEQIGVACKDIALGFEALAAIAGYDDKDGTSHEVNEYKYSVTNSNLNGLKIGVVSNSVNALEILETIKELTDLGAEVIEVDVPRLEHASGAAYTILTAEISNSVSRFDGIKFGYRTGNYSNLDDIYVNSRSECFTSETKLMILSGMLGLSKEKFDVYYNNSLKIRRMIKESIEDVLEPFDAVLMPVENEKTDGTHSFENFSKAYANLKYLSLPNLTTMPAMSLSNGVQFIAKRFDENTLFKIGISLENKKEGGRA